MQNNKFLINNLIEAVDEGIILVDTRNIIQLINKNAKETLGILIDREKTHSFGRVTPGDIVIIVNNILGEDDGNLSSKDLELINIKNNDIKKGDAIIAIGVYGNNEIKPIYKYWRKTSVPINYAIETKFHGFNISAYIDINNNKMTISVNDVNYDISYIYSVGHMVVLDGKSGLVKFFQAKGYTIRKENIKNILHGKEFRPKDPNEKFNVVGKSINEIIEHSKFLDEITDIFNGKRNHLDNEYYEINKRPTLCSFTPIINEDKIDGIIIKIKNVSELENLLKDRNDVLNNMEKIEETLRKKSLYYNTSKIESIIGSSSTMRKVTFLVEKASKIKSTVLITGESGTGKSMLAKIIHELHNKSNPFIHVNCSAIPANLFESELFGYEKGAFTGANVSGKKGYFELANGGTLFLDEIGEIPSSIQVKLLHALQNKCFYRVGSQKPMDVDVRIIAATNKNLDLEVDNGNFREDLYYRINVFPIEMPPLRERKKDIYLLINSILNKLTKRLEIEPKQLSASALNKLINYDWPGNIRELENVLERAVSICDTKIIHSEYINLRKQYTENNFSLKDIVANAEKEAILKAIKRCGNNKTEAMKQLNISRSTFYEKIARYNININSFNF